MFGLGFVLSGFIELVPKGGLQTGSREYFPAYQNTNDGRYVCDLRRLPTGGMLVRFESARLEQGFAMDLFHTRSSRKSNGRMSINLVHLEGQSIVDTVRQLQKLRSSQGYISDRATTTLRSGQIISAALTTQLRDGEIMYVVVLDAKPSSIDDAPPNISPQQPRKTREREKK